MKKNSGLFALIGLVALLATLCAFLFPLAPGLVDASTGDALRGYNFIFSNDAQGSYDPNGGLIGAFSLMVIAAVFQLFGFIFSFGEGGRKFSAFMHIVAGLCMVAAAVLFFLAKVMVGSSFLPGADLKLGWGFIAAGISAAISGLLSCGAGFKVYNEK
jgi:hypothetical protein